MSTQNSIDNADIKLMIDVFNQVPIEHGQEFDDHRRWCGICSRPKMVEKQTTTDSWAHKICPTCTAVWPEYITQYLDDDDDQDFPMVDDSN